MTASEVEPMTRCCDSHDDRATLAEHLVKEFPDLGAGDVVRELSSAKSAVADFGIEGPEMLEVAELMTRHQRSDFSSVTSLTSHGSTRNGTYAGLAAPSLDVVAEAARLTIDQLAVRSGMTVRNIRAHVTRGLLPPPEMQGRTAYYGPQHVARLQLITGLQQQGFNLAAISKLVSGPAAPSPQETVSFYRTALGPWLSEDPEIHDERELAAQFGLLPDPNLVLRLQQLRLLEPLPGGRVRVLNPSILRAGRELAQLGFTTEQLVDVLRVLLRHSRAVADAFVDMFLETHWTSYVDDGLPPERLPELSRIIQALQPLATQAVVAAFQQEMSAASGDAFDRAAPTGQTDDERPAVG